MASSRSNRTRVGEPSRDTCTTPTSPPGSATSRGVTLGAPSISRVSASRTPVHPSTRASGVAASTRIPESRRVPASTSTASSRPCER
ncbi:MAG TPA: hypothetical protein DEF51_12250 [Myxococcales bacterium]|nr:hypothetical protein [Myxococcales bacterium]